MRFRLADDARGTRRRYVSLLRERPCYVPLGIPNTTVTAPKPTCLASTTPAARPPLASYPPTEFFGGTGAVPGRLAAFGATERGCRLVPVSSAADFAGRIVSLKNVQTKLSFCRAIEYGDALFQNTYLLPWPAPWRTKVSRALGLGRFLAGLGRSWLAVVVPVVLVSHCGGLANSLRALRKGDSTTGYTRLSGLAGRSAWPVLFF